MLKDQDLVTLWNTLEPLLLESLPADVDGAGVYLVPFQVDRGMARLDLLGVGLVKGTGLTGRPPLERNHHELILGVGEEAVDHVGGGSGVEHCDGREAKVRVLKLSGNKNENKVN